MTGLIGICLIVWGVRSLFTIRKRRKSMKKSKQWANQIIKNLEIDRMLSNKL